MEKILNYKGYQSYCYFDENQGVYVGRVSNCDSSILFKGYSPTQINNEFINAVDLYLELCHKKGIMLSKHYSKANNTLKIGYY